MEAFCRIFGNPFISKIKICHIIIYFMLLWIFMDQGFGKLVMVRKKQGYGISARDSSGLQENDAKL